MASFLGVLVWITVVVSGRGDVRFQLPLGSFLEISAVVMAAIGPLILTWWYATVFSWSELLFS